MATFEKRGKFWRVKIRRGGAPAQTRTFVSKTLAQQWARTVEGEIDNGVLVDRGAVERTSLARVLERYRLEVTLTKRGSADEDSARSRSSISARCRAGGSGTTLVLTGRSGTPEPNAMFGRPHRSGRPRISDTGPQAGRSVPTHAAGWCSRTPRPLVVLPLPPADPSLYGHAKNDIGGFENRIHGLAHSQL